MRRAGSRLQGWWCVLVEDACSVQAFVGFDDQQSCGGSDAASSTEFF